MSERPAAFAATVAGACFCVLWLPTLSPHYGFYSDELYYLACADRPAWGYVDHPPLFVMLLKGWRATFGDSLLALRALPAACGAATVFLTGWMAHRMGGDRYAQGLSMLALMVGQSLANFGFFSVNCLAILLWTAATAMVVERGRSGNARWWLGIGVVLGLGFLTKHTILLLLTALVVGLLVTDLRRDLRTPWPWCGALAFLLLAAPNLAWQIGNDWPSLAFYARRHTEKVALALPQAVALQVFAQNPATFPVWAAGAWWLLRSPAGGPFRGLGWAFVWVLGLVIASGQSIPYRSVGIYPVAFAAGGVWLTSLRRPEAEFARRLATAWILPALIVVSGVAAASLVLPVLPPETMRDHPLHSGDDVWRKGVGGTKRPPYHLANRTHWRDLVALVGEVHTSLEPGQRQGAVVLADYFGHAGAVERYGAQHGLPAVYSNHTGYYLWGPPEHTPPVIVSIGIEEALLQRHYRSVAVAAIFRCELCPAWQDELPIRVAIGPTTSVAALWRELGEVHGMDRYRRLLRDAGSE